MTDQVTKLGAAAPKLPAPRMKPLEYQNTVWGATLDEGVTFERVLSPDFWGHVAQKFKAFDEIVVRAGDGSWVARLLVVQAMSVSARVKTIYHLKTDADALPAEAATHEVKHRGPKGWSIIRLKDKAIIKEGIASREEANRELSDYLKALAA